MACPNCGAPGGGLSGCGSCGLGRDPNVGGAFNAGQDQIRQNIADEKRRNSNKDCFPGDAKVLTPCGQRRLDSIKKGDLVLSIDAAGDIVTATVKRIISHHAHPILQVVSQNPELSFCATKRHPVQTHRGWVRIKDLCAGDMLSHVAKDGEFIKHKVHCVVQTKRVEPVYNIVVDGNHTYIVHGCIAHSFVYFRELRCWMSYLLKRINRNKKPIYIDCH